MVTVTNPTGNGGKKSNGVFFQYANSTSSVTLGAASNISVGSRPQAIIAADFNSDGKLDLVVANEGTCKHANPDPGCIYSSISYLKGNGNGTFQTISLPLGEDFPYALAAGDFNGDGKLDFAAADEAYQQDQPGKVTVFLNQGTSNVFSTGAPYPTGDTPSSIAVGDFNCDGILDLITANNHRIGSELSILRGNGSGGFLHNPTPGTDDFNICPAGSPCPRFPIQVITLDGVGTGTAFQNDGVLDAAVLSWNDGLPQVSLMKGSCTAPYFTAQNILPTKSGSTTLLGVALVAGDFIADSSGNLDLVYVGNGSSVGSIGVQKGDPTTGYTNVVCTGPGCSPPKFPNGLAAADFNADGILDVAAASGSFTGVGTGGYGMASVLLGGTGTFASVKSAQTGAVSTAVAIADFNSDGKPDLAVTNYYSNTVSIILQQ